MTWSANATGPFARSGKSKRVSAAYSFTQALSAIQMMLSATANPTMPMIARPISHPRDWK